MHLIIRHPLIGLLLISLLSGCSHVAIYNPSYLTDSIPVEHSQAGKGRVLILTDASADAYKFVGNPTSFTGGGTTLALPLGIMTREIALRVFGEVYKDGHDRSNTVPAGSDYAAIITPRVTHFEYAYNQLKNAGFAVTPQVRMTLTVKLIDSGGGVLLDKSYDSGLVDGKTYLMTGEPAEKINRTAHMVLYDLMLKASNDVIAVTQVASSMP
jgi:hypothetical protein